jgi:SAM-dependent methyltransferase
MTLADRARWEEKYRAGVHPESDPDPVLLRALPFAPPRGRALDVACGRGRHAIALARLCYRVDAVDVSPLGLASARGRAGMLGVRWIEADLDGWMPEPGAYALITCVNFTDDALLRRLLAALAPGGVLAYASNLRGNRRHGPRPGDIGRWFAPLRALHAREADGRAAYAGRKSF